MSGNSNAAVIVADGITKTYGKGANAFNALSDINLSIKLGEALAIVGESGSGKSTLMHVLALLDKPIKGSLLIGGKKASRLTKKQVDNLRNRHFGFVFQQFFSNEKDSVLNNVTLPLKIGKVGHRERTKRGFEVLTRVELKDKARSKAGSLSGGQKQRVWWPPVAR